MAAATWVVVVTFGLIVLLAGVALFLLCLVMSAISDANRFLGGDLRAADPSQDDRP